jgi:hypothetical protein
VREQTRLRVKAMRVTFAPTLRRLAFAPFPAPPGLFAVVLRLIVRHGFLARG